MRLMVISHTYIESTYRSKWLALRDIGSDVECLVVTPTYWQDREFGRSYSVAQVEDRLRFVPISAFVPGFVSRHIYISPDLPRLMQQFQPDVVEVEAEMWSAVYLQALLLIRLLVPKAKLVNFSWWNTLDWDTPLHAPGSLLYKIGLRATHLIIAGNHGAVDIHREQGYIGPISLIPQNGVNRAEYYPACPRPDLFTRYGLAGEFVIGYAGRLHVRKGVDTLLDAVAGITNVSWKLLIVGNGPCLNMLKGQAGSLGISERVVFTGAVPRSQIPDHIQLMNVLVLPSTKAQWEQFGRVLVEAMASGLPCIVSTNVGCTLRDGVDGFMIPIRDLEALKDRIRRLYFDPGLRKSMGAAARARAERFSWQEYSRRLALMYRIIHSGERKSAVDVLDMTEF